MEISLDIITLASKAKYYLELLDKIRIIIILLLIWVFFSLILD
jgi:hypothetical protein